MTGATRVVLMSASVVVFIFNDALVKLRRRDHAVGQAIGLRGVFATAWCVLAMRGQRASGGRCAGVCHPAVVYAACSRRPQRSPTWWRCSTFPSPSPPPSTSRHRCFSRGAGGADAERSRCGWRRWSAIVRRFRGRADGDPAAPRRRQCLDLAGRVLLASPALCATSWPLRAARRADARWCRSVPR